MKKYTLLFALLYMGWFTMLYSQKGQNHSFIHVNSENGLSQSNVKSIVQDSYGFIWFGTKNGLNRFDGKSVVQFDCNDYIRQKGNHNISALFEDDKHILWIGTDEGVYQYNPVTDLFTFVNIKSEQGVQMINWVNKIESDREGNIWIVIPDQGVFRCKEGRLYHYEFKRPHKTDSPNYMSVCDDGEIWVCSWNTGLFRYNAVKDTFEQVLKDINGRSLLNIETNTISQQGDYLIMAVQSGDLKKYNYKKNLLEDVTLQTFHHTIVRNATVYDDEIWVGTYDGLYVLNEKEGKVDCFRQGMQPYGLSDDIIYSIYRDREGGVWLGTMFGGANYMANRTVNFSNHIPEFKDKPLSSKRIREIAEDDSGCLWIGTEGAGMNILSYKKGEVTPYIPQNTKVNANITLAVSTHKNRVFCGYYKEGLEVIENGTSTFYNYKDLNIEGSSIYAFFIDHNENMWIGTDFGAFFAPKGEMRFNKVTELENNWIFDIMQDTEGIFWFATMGKGVWKYNPSQESFTHYVNEEQDIHSVSSSSVSSIMQDRKGNIWFSTDRGGICRYNKKEDNFTRFSKAEGLPDDVAYKILEDDNSNLWFGTNRGLVRLNPENGKVRVFTVKEGICGNQFNYKSAVKGSDGNFYFGTIDGLVSFSPNRKRQSPQIPPLYITKLSIFNDEITVHSPNSPLTKSILETESITLPYNRTNISFDISLLSYSASQAKGYYYKLYPIDKQWISSGTGQKISYAKLLPGRYELQIRVASEEDGSPIATSIRKLTIVVSPPWWQSTWAFLLYFVLSICIITLWFLWYRQHKNKQLAERQKLFEIEKEKELFENRVSFFTEIAHEIKTPLTLINGPLEIIEEMELKDGKLSKYLKVIAQNVKRLLNLATQLLDFQKVGANKLVLNYEVVDISKLLLETVTRFEPTFVYQHKSLEVVNIEEGVVAKVDKEAITKILSNLLNNALKYGNNHIKVELRRVEDLLFSVIISSDGTKIPADKIEEIFEPFYQLNGQEKEVRGVGIGLALSRSLALLHKGTLTVDSEQELNTFVLNIPLNMEAELAETAIIENTNDLLTETVSEEKDTKCNIILLVEDERDILQFMEERLSEFFVVVTAPNGKEALDILGKEHIDLVISDIMMPVMNGLELCKAIKSDINMCHTPVIFLTAKNDIDSKIQGLKMGAESYIEKPFSFDYLKMQIISLLNNRQKEREAFSKRPFFPIKNVQMSKEDEEFMNKVIQVINENITDENFNVERMADVLCMSRSSLLRKIKTLFNLSPIDFIRLIRLKKAAELIQEGKYRVGEICFMVGLNSHSYFSKLFYKQFGMTPKDFEKQVESARNKSRDGREINLEELLQQNSPEAK